MLLNIINDLNLESNSKGCNTGSLDLNANYWQTQFWADYQTYFCAAFKANFPKICSTEINLMTLAIWDIVTTLLLLFLVFGLFSLTYN